MIAVVYYRNPFEEWLWESGAMFWGIVAIFAALAIGGAVTLWDKWRNRRK